MRPDNQDAYLCRPDLGLFAVIDGMGGQQGGRHAAELARAALLETREPARGLAAANARIRAEADTPVFARMFEERTIEPAPVISLVEESWRTVALGVLLRAGQAAPALVFSVFWVTYATGALSIGAGQALNYLLMGAAASLVAAPLFGLVSDLLGRKLVYLAGAAGCEQLTRDHTVAASEQERLGLSHERAGELPGRNQVTRDLGGRHRQGEAWIDRLEVPLEHGALLPLCSDGLPTAVGADELFQRLRESRRAGSPPEELADALITRALERGARDNVTAVVVRQEGEIPPAPPRRVDA